MTNTENWITLTSIKTRGEIRCQIANTRVNHSKKAKLNIMHVTVNFLGLFFRTGKIFFGLIRFSCLSVRMTDNFSLSFGKSGHSSCSFQDKWVWRESKGANTQNDNFLTFFYRIPLKNLVSPQLKMASCKDLWYNAFIS